MERLMPTVRTPIKRAARKLVTDEARKIYADAVELQGIYHGCNRSVSCRSTSLNQYCAECSEYLDLSRELGRLLGLKPWESSPINTNSATAPDYIRRDPSKAQDWAKAWALRLELTEGTRHHHYQHGAK
jgi:hypothetical protein